MDNGGLESDVSDFTSIGTIFFGGIGTGQHLKLRCTTVGPRYDWDVDDDVEFSALEILTEC